MDSGRAGREAARVLLSLVLLAGIGIGVYLAWHHDNQKFGDASARLANCPETATINCELVNTSPWSELFGVPIAAYAIPTYLLTLILIWGGRRRPRMLGYAFCIGLAACAVSALLFYISKTQIGFLCAWCLRLYVINASIPVLAALAAWRSPQTLFGDTVKDLKSWPGALRFTAGAFLLLLMATVAVQQGYKSQLRRKSAEDMKRIMDQGGPTVPASPDATQGVPPSGGSTPIEQDSPASGTSAEPPPAPDPGAGKSGAWLLPSAGDAVISAAGFAAPVLAVAAATPPAPATAGANSTTGVYSFAAPVRRITGSKAGIKSERLDLKSRLGKGKPVALIFWAPGYHYSERALMEWTAFLKASAPQFEVYAVSGRNEAQRDEEIWETYAMLGASVPLLVDDGFRLSGPLQVSDVPNLALFSAKGQLVIAKIKQRRQLLIATEGNVEAEQIVRRVAAGEEIPTIMRMFPYYPAAELFGACAPAFTLKKFNTQEPYTFTGKSPSGRPTLVIFWSSVCPHCVVEIPQLVKWVKAHPDKIDVVSVTHIRADKPGETSHRAVTAAYVRTQEIPWVVLEDPGHAVEELYGVVSTPTTVFVAPDGHVTDAWYYAHEEGFEDALAKELTQASTPAACKSREVPPGPKMDFTVAGADNKRVAIGAIADRPSIVHFWATWCQPCIKELPSLVRLRDKMEKDGTGSVIFVSVEEDRAASAIAKFQKQSGLDMHSYRAPRGGLAEKVDLSYRVPRSYLVAPGGTLLISRQGSQNWDDPKMIDWASSRLAGAAAAASPGAAARAGGK